MATVEPGPLPSMCSFEWESIHVDFRGKLQRAQIDTQRALHKARAGTGRPLW